MSQYNLVAENENTTVIAEYQSPYGREKAYQSEAELEREFIKLLGNQAYGFVAIKSEKDLVDNLRTQLEALNDYKFTNKEWDTFFRTKIANPNSTIPEKTTLIQEDYIQLLTREDGSVKNIYLMDKVNIHNNRLQVINQYEIDGASATVPEQKRSNRYDVTVLVNGLPMVHIELKRRGVDIQEAFNQIDRYQRESFWAGTGLYEYIQIFVISNGTYTKYYSNTTRDSHIREMNSAGAGKKKKTSNSFEFTSWWADANNKPITDLMDFGRTFFSKHTLLNILVRYCVFTSDKTLLVMRPYQIVATERILNRVEVATNYKKYGTVEAGGYIWHTTGSGKTLTSFKTAQLAAKQEAIKKVIFIVDRKDLDYQTMVEYDKFEKGSANSNTSTKILKKQLEDPNTKIIITTIQKLAVFIKQNQQHGIYQEPLVMIFDECHRSQFGEMHKAIVKKFKKYFIFGFTGTPIFAKNAGSGTGVNTTAQAFGDKLHTYTIVDAINDKNVLPFRIEYIATMREKENIVDEQVWDIDREKALADPRRINNIASYILKHFDQKTMRNKRPYLHSVLNNIYEVANARDRAKIEEVKQKIRLSGFNSIFAVSSIDFAKAYYNEFKKLQSEKPELSRLKVATIFSYGQNDPEDDADGLADENPEDTTNLNSSDRDFLEGAIQDYNKIFGTSYDTSSDKFQSYYKDVSLRMKNREIDLLIVVNMFLTGFDATTLNTLWVDKNLRMQGLLQAFSRTNRILNQVKSYGNIVCFRNLENATNESIALFGNKEAGGIVLLKTYEQYYYGYDDETKSFPGYYNLVRELENDFPVGKMIIGEQKKKEFIKLYGTILKVKNILVAFDQFEGQEILSERDVQDYHSMYISLYSELRKKDDNDVENVNDDIVFEMELIKQVEINIDYILQLIHKYYESHLDDKEIVVTIQKAIDSSPDMRNKKDLIENFIATLSPNSAVDEDWQKFINQKKRAELQQIISEEDLRPEETFEFINKAFCDGFVQTTGTKITEILPPVSRFSPTGDRSKKKETVIEKLTGFFNRFKDLVTGGF